jgi:hypothetical protein
VTVAVRDFNWVDFDYFITHVWIVSHQSEPRSAPPSDPRGYAQLDVSNSLEDADEIAVNVPAAVDEQQPPHLNRKLPTVKTPTYTKSSSASISAAPKAGRLSEASLDILMQPGAPPS